MVGILLHIYNELKSLSFDIPTLLKCKSAACFLIMQDISSDAPDLYSGCIHELNYWLT
jgi:hypothetical protein